MKFIAFRSRQCSSLVRDLYLFNTLYANKYLSYAIYFTKCVWVIMYNTHVLKIVGDSRTNAFYSYSKRAALTRLA